MHFVTNRQSIFKKYDSNRNARKQKHYDHKSAIHDKVQYNSCNDTWLHNFVTSNPTLYSCTGLIVNAKAITVTQHGSV